MSEAAYRPLWSAALRQPSSSIFTTCKQCQISFPGTFQMRASSSNSRWKMRQGKDFFAREAKVQGLKSRAAFKLLEMDAKYKIFRKGQTVVDLVAVERTKPNGQILGIDIIPAQPPKGVSTIQGNFLSPDVQGMVKDYLERARHRKRNSPPAEEDEEQENDEEESSADSEATVIEEKPSYIDMERAASETTSTAKDGSEAKKGRLVDIVLSDMSAPWDQTSGFGVNSLSNPYHRMMNTSGMAFRDHAGSMDLCGAALQFANDTLKNGGHFVCKFYQGSEDREFEKKLKTLFAKVFREKPESSRSDSKEAYFVALRRKGNVSLESDDL
ncbi:ribosomal RNA large subunit methyltransferase j [Colletotrichum scovillei]|uniref:rRNA methyltransferase 2, mitochondrial n=1 Tax=Colletotrichum scovillei TaxID=1209932 RepID=A0A9P7QVC8_9PEZI|nr:ribosomal RNA large subunit methyltransferase j [Colletotrichum scovillei]KAG7045935.1 ribosomal RNA large subunit methyltransferase j [Colletotrichum scovillei]